MEFLSGTGFIKSLCGVVVVPFTFEYSSFRIACNLKCKI